jgi:hypothetical protein
MSSPILDLGPDPSAKAKQQTLHTADDRAQMGDLIEETRSDVRRMRTQLERQEDEQESHARRSKVLFITLSLLIILFAGAFWLAYPTVRDQQKNAVGMLSLQNVSSTLGKRVQSLEGKLDATISGLPALSDRMEQLSTNMKSGLQGARSQADAAATRIRAEVNQSIQAIQSRVAGLESNQKEASGHVNQLEEQIAALKQELATVREESSAAADRIKQQLQDEQQVRASTLSSIDQKMTSHQTALDSVSNRIDSKRVDFALQNNHKTEQIAPEVYLTVRRMDTRKQEIDATLQLSRDSRMVPIRAMGIRSPMVFYTTNDTRPMTLVLTEVAKNRVSGYVMMPAPPISATSASNTQ